MMSYVHVTYAKVGADPSDGDMVVGGAEGLQWNIKETGKHGAYV
jgi:hypothetical protein